MTKGPEIYQAPKGATVHATFTTSELVFKYVNGEPVPELPDRGYNPDAFVVLRDVEWKRGGRDA